MKSKKKSLHKAHQYFERILNFFNLGFFVISIAIWIYLTAINLLTQPFQISLLWDAFNVMYGQISFKIGCIILIIFNGLQTIQSYFGYYYSLKDYHQHVTTLGKIIKNNSHKQ